MTPRESPGASSLDREIGTMSFPPERLPAGSSSPALPTIVTDATCTACGCLCDDLGLAVAEGRIVAAERACEIGRRWFLADHEQGGVPPATVAGRAVEPE